MKVLLAALLTTSALAAETSPAACAVCHRAQTSTFAHADMTRALETVKECQILRAHTKMTAKLGAFSYEITRSGDQSTYTVTDGKDTIRVPIQWAFGLGSAGQTYLFQRDGRWYESRVSYYSALNGLDVTMGAQGVEPRTLDQAAGRQTGAVDIGQCFDCHATQAVKGMQLTLDRMIPGIQCERCHGDSQGHPANRPMHHLGKLTSEETSDFCGQCHRTWSQIALNGPRGINNVRFQPYRLANSKCYSADDKRISCTTCHNPHQPLETSAAAYDGKCIVCHVAPARVCSVATKDCTTCHMPRLELPGSHKQFTDHLIRIVKANEKYPD
jgi:hypothetical protein